MVNGKPQIYFEEIGSLAQMLVYFPSSSMYLIDEPQEKPQTKTKRNSRAVNTTRVPEQPKPKQTVQKPAPVPQSVATKQPKKTHKIVVNDKDASVGVFMTMEEIAELVKAVKDTSRASKNPSFESQGTVSNAARHVKIVGFQCRDVSTTTIATATPNGSIATRFAATAASATTTTTTTTIDWRSCTSIRFTTTIKHSVTARSNLTSR